MAAMAAAEKKQPAIAMVPMGHSIEPLVVTLTGRNDNFLYPTQSGVYDEIITSKGYTQVRDDTAPGGFKNKRGSSNFAYFFKHPDPTHKPQELVFRRTSDPVMFNYEIPKVDTIKEKYRRGEIREDRDAKRSRVNWLESARLNIAPKIYFYGYIRKPSQNSGLYLAVVSEGFDTDLRGFYKDVFTPARQGIPKNALTPTDIAIQRQITHQLNTTAKEMNVVCFDIKPMNTVISYKPDGCHREASLANPIVRLIDWDGDYCIKYRDHMNKSLQIRESTTTIGRNNRQVTRYKTVTKSNKEIEGYISNIIMANHFFVNFDRNIFAQYFNSKKEELDSLKPKLTQYFCSLVYGDPEYMFGSDTASLYHFFARHYLEKRDIPIPGRIEISPFKQADKNRDNERPRHAMCRKLFREMYKRIFVINEAALTGQPQEGKKQEQSKQQDARGLEAIKETREDSEDDSLRSQWSSSYDSNDNSYDSNKSDPSQSYSDFRTPKSRGGKRKKRRTGKTRRKRRRKNKKRGGNRKTIRKNKKKHRRRKKSRKH